MACKDYLDKKCTFKKKNFDVPHLATFISLFFIVIASITYILPVCRAGI